MITAAITAAIAGLLSLVGIKPGPYLVAVAVVVKVLIVCSGLLIGSRWALRRKQQAEAAAAPPPAEAPIDPRP